MYRYRYKHACQRPCPDVVLKAPVANDAVSHDSISARQSPVQVCCCLLTSRFTSWNGLHGQDAAVVGYRSRETGGALRMNPPDEDVLGDGDAIIALAETGRTP